VISLHSSAPPASDLIGSGSLSPAHPARLAGLRRLLWQRPDRVDFGLRRFRLRPGPARTLLEGSGRAFLAGFNAVLAVPRLPEVLPALEGMPADQRGFAAEGAGMAAAMLDVLGASGGRRTATLLDLAGDRYPHLVHVGVGWAYARLRLRPWRGNRAGDPLLRWLAWDGLGFHQAFFTADRVVGQRRRSRRTTGAVGHIHDQGVGRALWFHECADPTGAALRIAEFSPERQPDLWSGVGLAASYAGGAGVEDLAWLVELAEPYRADIAQGAAFGCKAHLSSGHVPVHTREAAPVLTGVPVEQAAAWTDTALRALGEGRRAAADYQRWRAGIRQEWARTGGGHA
jgi:enediyne biosynthesis protein E3